MTTVTCTSIIKEPSPSTRVLVNFSDGSQREYPSIEEMSTSVLQTDFDNDLAKTMLLAWWLARDADGSNTNIVEGKTLTFDLSAANLLKVT